VQQAVVPPPSTINKRVPPELDRIVAKALAREPANRYSSARELGQHLSKFLFGFGQPISTFDIATLVHLAMRDKKTGKQPQGSIIDKLIEEALLEFTSLTDEDSPEASKRGTGMSSVSGAEFIDPTDWANEIGLGSIGQQPNAADSMRASFPPGSFQNGNLSALEDDDPRSPADKSPQLIMPAPKSSPGASSGSNASRLGSAAPGNTGPGSISGSAPLPLVAVSPKKKGGAIVGVIVAAFALAAVTIAWTMHLIPHH
jgi:serine/threonine-protein kinase